MCCAKTCAILSRIENVDRGECQGKLFHKGSAGTNGTECRKNILFARGKTVLFSHTRVHQSFVPKSTHDGLYIYIYIYI